MKRLFIALIGLSFAATACNEPAEDIEKKEEVQEEKEQKKEVNLSDSTITYTNDQKAMMLFYTSTGCPGCGSWGSPTFETISEQYKDDVIPLAVHIKYGDPMITDISEAIALNRTGQNYTPQIWVNNSNIMVLNTGRIDGNASVQKAVETITTSSSKPPKANLATRIAYNLDSSKMQIKAGVMNNGDLDGQYFIASYILEDKIIWRQSGGETKHEHNYVIRSCSEGNFGEAVQFDNNKFETFNALELTDYWKRNELSVLTVVWKKVGTRYFYENAILAKP